MSFTLYLRYITFKIYKGQDPDNEAYSIFTKENKDIISSKVKATDLYISGLATDVCVKETCLDGLRLGYNVIMIEDCCRGIDKDNSEKAKKLIAANGGLVTNSNHVYSLVNEGKRSLIIDHHATRKHFLETSIPVDD